MLHSRGAQPEVPRDSQLRGLDVSSIWLAVAAHYGNEWVMLTNEGSAPVNLAGWTLRDEAGHTVRLARILAPGAKLKVRLAARQMPLNNGGDKIELLDANGQVVDKVSYVAGQVSPGREIRFRR